MLNKEFIKQVASNETELIHAIHKLAFEFLSATNEEEEYYEEKAIFNDKTKQILKVLGY